MGKNGSCHERCPYLHGKMVDFLGRDSRFESTSQNSGVTKHRLCTKCSDHLPSWRGGLGRPRLGTDTEDFFQEQVTLSPTWMRSMVADT
jgi:hypothetical protein